MYLFQAFSNYFKFANRVKQEVWQVLFQASGGSLKPPESTTLRANDSQ